MKTYKTIAEECVAEFVEKKSRFIGHICPVKTIKQANAFIEKISKQHYNATHNVFAYNLLEGQVSRYSDNGEPQGTAGIPVLDVLKKSEIFDVCVVATRYFGGTLLGGGGLVRAYSHTATIAIEQSEILTMVECAKINLKCDYSLYGKLTYVFPKFNIKILESDFSDVVELTLLIQQEKYIAFNDNITELTNAQAKIILTEQLYYAKEWFE